MQHRNVTKSRKLIKIDNTGEEIFISSEFHEEIEVFMKDVPILISEKMNFLSSTKVFTRISLLFRIIYSRKLIFRLRKWFKTVLGGCFCDYWKLSLLSRLILNWCTFSRWVTARWWRQWVKNQVPINLNSRNRWCPNIPTIEIQDRWSRCHQGGLKVKPRYGELFFLYWSYNHSQNIWKKL